MTAIRVFVLEDQPAMLKSLCRLVEDSNKTQLAGFAFSAEEAIRTLDSLDALPDIILADIHLPKMNGIDFCRWSRIKYPEVQVLMLTVSDQESQVLEAIKRGAAGYLLKGTESRKILEAIEDVHQGGSVIQPGLARSLLQHFKQDLQDNALVPESGRNALTERELECLQIIAKGLSNNEAAGVLGLSRATVRTHLEHIYQKLDVCNRVEAVTEGLRQGLIGI